MIACPFCGGPITRPPSRSFAKDAWNRSFFGRRTQHPSSPETAQADRAVCGCGQSTFRDVVRYGVRSWTVLLRGRTGELTLWMKNVAAGRDGVEDQVTHQERGSGALRIVTGGRRKTAVEDFLRSEAVTAVLDS